MGKASKFFKALFGFKTIEPTEPPPSRSDLNKQPKRHWSFIKSHRDKPSHHHLSNAFDASLSRPFDTPLHHHVSVETGGDVDGATTGSSNHAIAVAAATAAVAEAAVAAAHAAAEVVRMTSRTTAGYGLRAEWAAVKIQSYFRSYLARKALRALKGLVKLQALVRGHILRKQAADDLRRLQALQALLQARATRLHSSPQPTTKKSSSYNHHHGPPTPEKCEHVLRSRTTKHNHPSPLKNHGSRSFNDERNEKILEMDTTKPHVIQQQQPRRRNLFQPDHISYSHSQSLTTSRGSSIQPPGPSPSESCEINSLTAPLKCPINDIDEETPFCTAQNSPPFYGLSFKGNFSMRVGQFTPAKSDSSRSCLSGYSDHPNYMAYTESSRAKVRSLSAPRQRPPLELPKRYSMYGCGSGGQRGSNLRDSFVNKAYPGSGRLDRLGMPVGGMVVRESEFSGSYWN